MGYWKCKECGGDVVLIETEEYKSKYYLDKNKNKYYQMGYDKGDTSYIYECQNCGNETFYESELEDIAEWEEL